MLSANTYIYFKCTVCVFVCFQDLSSAMKEVEELTAQLCKQQQQSQQTAQELEQLRKVHTHTSFFLSHTAPLIPVSQRSCPVKRLVMASLQLRLHLTKKEGNCSHQQWN